MKFFISKQRIVNFSFAFLVFGIIIGVQVFTNYSSIKGDASSYSMRKELPPIDPIIPDSLPHYKYKMLIDSVKWSREIKNGTLTSWSTDPWFTGFRIQQRCDTCTARSFYDSEKDFAMDYLIRLNWWRLDTGSYMNPTVYYVKNGQSFLRKRICKLESVKGEFSSYACDEIDVAVPFRYDEKNHSMMIPVSKTTLDIYKPVVTVVGLGGSLIYFYFMLTWFLKILMDIRNGDPFSEGNVKRFKYLAVSCFLVPLLGFLLNLLMRLIFYRYFTPDIKLSPEAWSVFWKPFVLAVIFAALHVAFKQGKQLKDEQDLTV